jgi:hypothetical protein
LTNYACKLKVHLSTNFAKAWYSADASTDDADSRFCGSVTNMIRSRDLSSCGMSTFCISSSNGRISCKTSSYGFGVLYMAKAAVMVLLRTSFVITLGRGMSHPGKSLLSFTTHQASSGDDLGLPRTPKKPGFIQTNNMAATAQTCAGSAQRWRKKTSGARMANGWQFINLSASYTESMSI